MPSKKEMKKKMFYQLLGNPYSLVPFLGSVTAFTGFWVFDNTPALIASIAFMAVATGVFFTKLVFGSEQVAQKALDELEKETTQDRDNALDELYYNLRQIGDERDDQCLQDLRTLAESFKKSLAKSDKINTTTAFDIISGVEELFEKCVKSLEQTITLWETAERMTNQEVKHKLYVQRNSIIEEVEKSIEKLGYILAEMTKMSTGEGTSSDLQDLRDELEQSLEIARKVDQRMKTVGLTSKHKRRLKEKQ